MNRGEFVGRLVVAMTDKPVEGATIACGAVINDSLKGGGANAVTSAIPRLASAWSHKRGYHPQFIRANSVTESAVSATMLR